MRVEDHYGNYIEVGDRVACVCRNTLYSGRVTRIYGKSKRATIVDDRNGRFYETSHFIKI